MSARIARGSAGGGRRTPARASGGARKRNTRKTKKQGLLEGLPISPKTLRQLGWWGGMLALAILVIAAIFALRLPQRIGTAIGEQIGSAGFTVSRVELRGLNRMDRSTVYRTVLDQPSMAMPLVDLDGIRERLLAFPWIKEARVSRRLPDTLVVDVIERDPAAVWQFNRRLQLVDAEGVPLGPVDADAMPRLPLVIGPGAQHEVASLSNLLRAAPQLRPLIVGSAWVGGRRWDLRFNTGETVSLPEGDEAAKAALQRFAEVNGRRRLLGTNFLRFDMRIEGRMIVQLRNAPAAGVPGTGTGTGATPAPAPAPTPAPRREPPQDLSRTI